MNRPRVFSEIELYVSEACSLNCKYCFLPKNPEDSNKKTLKAILDWFFANSGDKVHIQIFGTEPLFRWSLLRYVFERSEQLAAKTGKLLTKGITTNCVALTKSKIQWLTDHKVAALCSIDGSKENHDRYRVFPDGKGSWDIVSRNAQNWVKQNQTAEAAMTVTPECIPNLAENLDAIYQLGFNCAVMNKLEDVNSPRYNHLDLNLFERKLDDVISLIISYASKGRKVHAPFLTNQMVHRSNGTAAKNPVHTCGAAKGSLSADIHGNLYICHRAIYDEIFKLGNVFDGINWNRVEWWRSQTHKNCGFCTMPNCSPCYTDSYHRHGDPFIISWDSCRFNQIIQKKSWDLERRMHQEGVYDWWIKE